MFSVEVLPDAGADAPVRAQWAQLVAAGLPSAGRQAAPSNRPHVTVAVRERVDPDVVASLAALLPVPLDLGGLLLFGHRGRFVLARAVIATAELLDLHRAVADAVGAAEPQHVNTAPGRWTPHVTLARRLTAAEVGHALAVLDSERVPGTATGLRVWNAEARQVTTLR